MDELQGLVEHAAGGAAHQQARVLREVAGGFKGLCISHLHAQVDAAVVQHQAHGVSLGRARARLVVRPPWLPKDDGTCWLDRDGAGARVVQLEPACNARHRAARAHAAHIRVHRALDLVDHFGKFGNWFKKPISQKDKPHKCASGQSTCWSDQETRANNSHHCKHRKYFARRE